MRPKLITILKFTTWLCLLLSLVAQPASGQIRKGTLVSPKKLVVASLVTPVQIRTALGLSAADVISISTGTSVLDGFDVFNSPATLFPTEGGSYLVLSSGATSSALTPNTEDDRSTELGGLNTTAGEDLVQIVLQLQPPPGATCLSFDFAFYSEEFPEFVGSEFNDAFIAEIGQSTFQIIGNQVIAPNNFAFDSATNVISVNTVFGVTAAAASGTTYDGGTPLLTAVTPLENPGQQITITLSIMDLGDSIFDSTVFIDNFRWSFGTDCRPGAVADSDGDGLLNDWEMHGIDFDKDGIIDLDLPAMGADPNHKDIFIEIDYMVLAGVGGHSHRPKLEALQTVIDAFANAPLGNPDGTTGIRIHIDAGANTIMNPVTGELWGARSRSDELAHVTNLGTMSGPNYNWAAFDGIKGAGVPGKFSIQRADVFHYCIFGHSLAPSLGTVSGIARGIPSSDFLVTLGGWTGDVGSINEQAGTLMHELGHNLGLRHGGDDHGNYKPNYLSIMNYSFQNRGLRIGGTDGHFDYSRFLLPNLNESALNENNGISGVAAAAGYGTRFYDGGGVARLANDINGPINWNNNAVSTDNPIAVDINKSGSLSDLGNADNWAQIVFDGGSVGHLGEAIILPMETIPDDIDEGEDLQIPTEFKVKVMGPGTVLLQPCHTQNYTYHILNAGTLDDTYTLTVTKKLPWADTSTLPAVLPLASGQSATFIVPVTIPDGTPLGTVDELFITAASMGNPLMLDVAETRTTAGTNPPPVIECPADLTVEFTSENGAVVLFTPIVTDNCPGVITVCVPASGSTFAIGTSAVHCTATDTGGSTDECSFTVTVLGPRGVKQKVLNELIALRATTTDKHDGDKLDKAIEHLAKSLTAGWWIDETHIVRKGGDKVFNEEKHAVDELEHLLKDKKSQIPDALLLDLIQRIVKCDRLLAVIALDEAAAAGLPQKKIDEDLKELAKGDEEAAKGKYGNAIEHYRHAWQHAVKVKIKPPQMLAGGNQRLEFIAVPGESYIIQASSNLVTWKTLGTVTADADGAIVFDDPDAANLPTRFYRVVEP